MKIVVIGGAGFIGSHTVDKLIEQGHSVRVLDSLEKPVHLRGKPYTVKQLYEKVAKIFNKNTEPRLRGEYRCGDTRHIFSDISKLKKLGWELKVPVEQSIREYRKYLEQQVNIEDILEYQNKEMRELNIVRRAMDNS